MSAKTKPQHTHEPIEVSDIIKIIIACRKNAVTSFDYKGLSLKLGAPEEVIVRPAHATRPPTKLELEALEREAEAKDKADELENLRLSDPAEYERRILEGLTEDTEDT